MHRIRLKKFVLNQPIEDNFREERLQQDELNTITWETNFVEQLATRGNEPNPTSMANGKRPITPVTNSTDARENEAECITTTDSPNDVNDVAQSQNERLKNDVSNRNEANEAEKNENSYWPDAATYHKNQEKSSPDLPKGQENDAIFWKTNLLIITMHKTLQKWGLILSCPKYLKPRIEMKI